MPFGKRVSVILKAQARRISNECKSDLNHTAAVQQVKILSPPTARLLWLHSAQPGTFPAQTRNSAQSEKQSGWCIHDPPPKKKKLSADSTCFVQVIYVTLTSYLLENSDFFWNLYSPIQTSNQFQRDLGQALRLHNLVPQLTQITDIHFVKDQTLGYWFC